MARDGLIVPAETSVLCEGCGYTLDGLPATGQCPECGLPIAASLAGDGRHLPAWEDPGQADAGVWRRFWRTSAAVIFRTGYFYRTLATRRDDSAALRFAQVHWVISAVLLGGALSFHFSWFARDSLVPKYRLIDALVFLLSASTNVGFIWGTTRLAARLTAWEAAYRGIRLPLTVVLRGLYYHAAHFLPVGLMAFVTTAGYWVLLRTGALTDVAGARYLYVLCIEVLLAAGYLFKTYWTGMKGTMYANR